MEKNLSEIDNFSATNKALAIEKPSIEVSNKQLHEAIKQVINSTYSSYKEAVTPLYDLNEELQGIDDSEREDKLKKKVQDLKNLLLQVSKGKGNLSNINKILKNINYEIIYTLKPIGEMENISGFPADEFEKLIATNKIRAAEDLLFKKGRSLPTSIRLKLETKLEEAKPLNLGSALVPLKLTVEALERVMSINEDNSLSDKVCSIIYRESLSEKLIDTLLERLDSSQPEDRNIKNEIRAWKTSLKLMEVEEVEGIIYRNPKIAVIDYKVYARLKPSDTTLIEITDLFETTFLREACLKKNQSSFKVTELVRKGEINDSIVVSYKNQIYRTFSGEPDSKRRKIALEKE